jgi:hypothetical protein
MDPNPTHGVRKSVPIPMSARTMISAYPTASA